MFENNEVTRTTIVVDTATRDKLKEFGNKGETYEDIILRLLESYEGKTKK